MQRANRENATQINQSREYLTYLQSTTVCLPTNRRYARVEKSQTKKNTI